jgi:hypothetical protein
MGLLDEASLEKIVATGCTACNSNKLAFRSYVDGALPIVGGEPVGRMTWVYDGEKFIDGVFEVACPACKQTIFSADICPRCHAPGGLAQALATGNTWPVPGACPECGEEELRYVAFVPANVGYEGKRAEKARTTTEMHDDGFHGARVECKACGFVGERTETCPLCESPGPLRARP